MRHLQGIYLIPLLLVLAWVNPSARAADDDDAWAPTPPRLSYIDGEVSYWREGADDWVRAQPNLALAEGDALYTGNNANFEVQTGSRNFVRADANSELALLNQEERFIQFKVTAGRVTFDMRSLAVGDTVEVSTPNAVFTIEHPGYYRVEVNSRDTHLITRRGGEATVTTADGRTLSIYASEDIVVTAGDPVRVATYAAAAPDAWDRWNDARSDRIGESISARYLPPGVYGVEELDYYGRWRVVPTYGPVWIPYGVSADWVPYSTGSWVWDPYYEWTWIDDAPWGWAPFHYGRWVYIDGFWAWTPGPVMRRPVYSPALVAFMIRDHDVSVHASMGLPGLWWVALSWGEPVVPWWSHHRHRGHPRWDGWGGPRLVNNVVVNPATVRLSMWAISITTMPACRVPSSRCRPTRSGASGFAPRWKIATPTPTLRRYAANCRSNLLAPACSAARPRGCSHRRTLSRAQSYRRAPLANGRSPGRMKHRASAPRPPKPAMWFLPRAAPTMRAPCRRGRLTVSRPARNGRHCRCRRAMAR